MNILKPFLPALVLSFLSTSALADACDWRPSYLLTKVTGDRVSASTTATIGHAVVGTVGGVGASGGVMTAAGFYIFPHTAGMTMLGSTLAGPSAAGTVGIISGTGGAIGTTAAALMNPFVWVPAAVAGIGGSGFEAGCAFLVDERITEFDEIMTVMTSFVDKADPAYFKLVEKGEASFIVLTDLEGRATSYDIEDLYIVNGILMHRDWGPNTEIGFVGAAIEVE